MIRFFFHKKCKHVFRYVKLTCGIHPEIIAKKIIVIEIEVLFEV